ncbi:MAG TPA: hypothetical protein VMV39_02260 [Terracidiphilus sp.]|nr:hypothetical protein [Terracidiphilus sp.]
MNSPGPEAGEEGGAATGGGVLAATGSASAFALIERNICVKLPGVEGLIGSGSGSAGWGCCANSPGAPAGAADSADGFFSTETWLKTFAKSSEGLETGGGADVEAFEGVVSAWSIRVNSPGPEDVAGAGVAAGCA